MYTYVYIVKYHLRRGVGLIKFLKMVLDPSPPPLVCFLSTNAHKFVDLATRVQ